MKELHILFTGVGRRVELMQAFRYASRNLNIDMKLYGADMSYTAPALAFCDYTRIICSMQNEQYIPQLLEICEEDNIDLVIPTIDTDLLILSQNKQLFDKIGTKVLISASDKIAICRDKNHTGTFFESCGLLAPKTVNNYNDYTGDFPCFIKPKDGSSSVNAYKVSNLEELVYYSEKIKDYIIQPFIDGIEYTVDIFCDFDGNPIYITPRERQAVRSGEVLKTKIELDSKIIEECRNLINKFCPCGPITVQLIRETTSGLDYYIEINPRFGGGAPLSMKAGANSAEMILKLLCGNMPMPQEDGIADGAIYSRYDQSVCVKHGERLGNIKGVIFDLDDTLYSEKDYVRSGYRAIADYLKDELAEEELWKYFLSKKPAIDCFLENRNQSYKKAECLDIYRNHIPSINLYDGVEELLIRLRHHGIKIGIITDGRVQGQKNKLEALGLNELVDDIIITDELGGIQFRKPNDIAFRIMQCKWGIPFEQMIYVGDNVNKDFQAPRQLGMNYIWYNNLEGLYGCDCAPNIENSCDCFNDIIRILDK